MKLVSFCLFTYNQEKYVLDAIKGAFSQEYSPLEIIISDDNSTDNTYNIIQDTVKQYQGNHKIVVNRNEKNMGLVPHVNKILFDYAHGDYILLAAGDDISLPNRTAETVSILEKHHDCMGVVFPKIIIDKNGNIIKKDTIIVDTIYKIDDAYMKTSSFVVGDSALGFRKDILNIFLKLNDNCQTEDSTLRLRCLLVGGIISANSYGILYRMHDTNISRRENIFNLKTELIASQYRVDLLTAYNKGLINKVCYNNLEKKVQYYINKRNLDEQLWISKNILEKTYLYLKKMILIFCKLFV